MNKIVSSIKSGMLPCLLLCFALIAACGPKEDPVIAVTGVSLDQSSLTLDIGGTANLTATVSPSNAEDNTVNWSSSDSNVASVDQSGNVTALRTGTATITAAAGGKTATCSVTVSKKHVEVESVELDKTEVTITEGENTTLTATVKPDDATDPVVTWESNNPEVATVEDGVVTAVKEGTAVITAKAGEKEATCAVTVVSANSSRRRVIASRCLIAVYK